MMYSILPEKCHTLPVNFLYLSNVLTTAEILSTLDNCYGDGSGYNYFNFATLSHPYTFLIDSRINVFRDNQGQWAIAVEVLGFTPNGNAITLEIFYFGNCLKEIKVEDNRLTNSYTIYPVDDDSFEDTIEGECLKPDAKFWIVKGNEVPISHNKQDYIEAGVELKEYEPGEISAEEVGRLLIIQYGSLFRATDEELYKFLPSGIDKILVLDEWYHKEYYQNNIELPADFPTPEYLAQAYKADPEIAEKTNLDVTGFANLFVEQIENTEAHNIFLWNNNRPGSYETWQQIAEVIVSGDASFYKATLPSNSHWKNWPDSGSF